MSPKFVRLSLPLLQTLNRAGLLQSRLQALLEVLIKAQRQRYETRLKEVLPPAGAAYLKTAEDLGLETNNDQDSFALVVRLDPKFSTVELKEALADASIELIELPVSSQTRCVSYFVLRTSVKNSAQHDQCVALHTEPLLSLAEQAVNSGKSDVLVLFVHDTDAGNPVAGRLHLNQALLDKMRESVATAQAFESPTDEATLVRAAVKASKYGEEPALFLPYEVRPSGTGLKLELRLALMRPMYNSKRQAA